MHIRAPAILCSARPHGETAVIVQMLTREHGLLGAYVAGGRGRALRPVVIPGNLVEADVRSRSDSHLPFARLELLGSRGPWLGEPLPAAAIGWACGLAAAALPERHAYPSIHQALDGLLTAICHAPSARGWAGAMVAYEALVLRELGYGGQVPPMQGDWDEILARFDRMGAHLDHYLLADRRGNVMGARAILRDRLGRIAS